MDILNPKSFYNVDFDNSIIIDCINVNNGNKIEIENCNIRGFNSFMGHLTKNHKSIKYLYFSTISVLSEEIRKQNMYVHSKFIAENLLISSSKLNHHIVRLSYPIGKGENVMRLISRFVKSIKEGNMLSLSDIKINITPIECISQQINHLVKFETNKITFLSNNVYTSLIEIVNCLGFLLKKEPIYKITHENNHFEPKSDMPITCNFDLLECFKKIL